MRVVIQRVSEARVHIAGKEHSAIGRGLMILLGIGLQDTAEDVEWLCNKIVALRIFADEAGLMNKALADVGGALMLVSQFTLHASYKKGNRPSFITAARPEQAIPLYEQMIARLAALSGRPVATGVFGADMQVSLVNDGPVTILMDTQNKE
jgi:D-tyrosyl-tRNA(Tyr) deacylase